MPDVTGQTAIDVAIGLIFLFVLLSIVCSAINEAIAAKLDLRSKDLENGLRSMLGDGGMEKLLADPRIAALTNPGKKPGRAPSYIPSRVYALALLDTVAPPAAGAPSEDLIARAQKSVATIEQPAVKKFVEDALTEARGDVDRFRRSIEGSFDEVMDRVSGWYRRRVHWILIAIAVAVVGLSNADTVAIGERLWKDDALRAAVVARAADQANATDCEVGGPQSAGGHEPARDGGSASERAAKCVDEIEELGIPLGWTDETTPAFPDDWGAIWAWLAKLFGLLITVAAVSLGAPFWFDLLGKVARLRTTGPQEPTAATKRAG